MSHFNFVIPLNRDDLFESSAIGQYVVENVYNIRDLKIKIQDCIQSVEQEGAVFVLHDGFDVIFSVLQMFHKDISVHMKEQTMGIAMTGRKLQNIATRFQFLC